MKIKVYYNGSINMSKGKIASQVAHACMGLINETGAIYDPESDAVVVLKLSRNKFNEMLDNIVNGDYDSYVQKDMGKTEVVAGEATAFAYVESWLPYGEIE